MTHHLMNSSMMPLPGRYVLSEIDRADWAREARDAIDAIGDVLDLLHRHRHEPDVADAIGILETIRLRMIEAE